jgi:hypothetical protein
VTDHPPSLAERLDRAVDALLDGALPTAAAALAGLGASGRPLVEVADRAHAALPLAPAGTRFEARLGARLATSAVGPTPVAWARRHPGTLLVGGALGSAVGVGVTAFAVWRSGRRAGVAHRLLHR